METVKQAIGLSSGKSEDDVVGKEHQPGFKKQNQEFIGTVRKSATHTTSSENGFAPCMDAAWYCAVRPRS